MKRKLFSIGLITLAYRAGGGTQVGEKKDKRARNVLSLLLPPTNSCHYSFSLYLPPFGMFFSEHWERRKNECDICARVGSERGYPSPVPPPYPLACKILIPIRILIAL